MLSLQERALGLVATLLIVTSSLSAGMVYTGQLVWDANETQIEATAAWENTNTKIEWTVTELESGGFEYNYILTFPDKNISHLIFELSENIQSIDGVDSNDIGFYSASNGNSNPFMPEEMYGVKFNTDGNSDVVEVTFIVDRVPIWGDFYVKDGKDGGDRVVAWNTGFTANDVDPYPFLYGPDSNDVKDHILVPDTVGVPEPASMTLLGLGGIFAMLRRKRR